MDSYELGPKAIEQLRRVVRHDIQRAVRRVLQEEPTNTASQLDVYICKTPAGGIAAMSSDTPGSAACIVYGLIDDALEKMTDSEGEDIEVTVYNIASNAVDGSTYIQAKQEQATGMLMADFEDCD